MTHQTVRDAIANFCAGEFDPADVAELVRFAESHLGDDDDEPVTYDDLINAAAFTCEPFFTVSQARAAVVCPLTTASKSRPAGNCGRC